MKAASNPTPSNPKPTPKPNTNTGSANNSSSSSGSTGSTGSGGYSGGSSSGSTGTTSPGTGTTGTTGSTGSGSSSQPATPQLVVSPEGGKTTVVASKSENLELTLKLGDKIATDATFEGMTPADYGDGAPNVTAKAGVKGVFIVGTLPKTKPGKYTLKFKTSDGKTTEKEITVQKQHTKPAKLTVQGTGEVQSSESAAVAIAKLTITGDEWDKIKAELADSHGAGHNPSGLDFGVKITGLDGFDATKIEEHASIDPTFHLINAYLKSEFNCKGKSFTVQICVKGKGFYTDSEYSDPITIKVKP